MKEIEKLQSIQDRSIRKKKRDCPDILLYYSCLNYELISRVALVEIQICVFFFILTKNFVVKFLTHVRQCLIRLLRGSLIVFSKLLFFFFEKPYLTHLLQQNRTVHYISELYLNVLGMLRII